jgi:RNA polymerase sigma-70 factor (ECF subfamily)
MPDRETDFVQLVRANDARLRKICRVYADREEARRDLYQDILVALWRALPSFEGNAQPSTWLYRIALNTALSHERKQDVRDEATLNPDAPIWTDGLPQPEEHLETQDKLDRLYAAIDRLGDVDKALVTMYLDERSYHEIADVLGISESYVGVKLHRIKNQLADWLEETPA